jgi:hypothetical protein
MNEVSNFCNTDGKGQVCVDEGHDGDCKLTCLTPDPTNTYDFPPYNIGKLQPLIFSPTR